MNANPQDEEIEKQPSSLQVLSTTLPENVVFEHILPKLPVKSLLRFKSVSKVWLSLISSPDFIKTHFNVTSSSAHSKFLLRDPNHGYFTLSYDEHKLIEFTPLGDEVHKLGWNQRFIGCCNGLVCVYVCSCDYFVIWNPAIRAYKMFTVPKRVSSKDFRFEVFGFGYSSVDENYKIVINVRSPTMAVFVYSSKQGNWKIIHPKLEIKDNDLYYFTGGIYVGDMLFWVLENADNISTTCLLSFNLVTEEFKVVHGPMDWASIYGTYKLQVIGGFMALCCYERYGRVVDVWIRKQKGGLLELWDLEKVYVFVITPKHSRYYEDFDFTRFGKRLVITSDRYPEPEVFKLEDPTTGEDVEDSKCIERTDPCCGLHVIDQHYIQRLGLPFCHPRSKAKKSTETI